jgi:hypothetical protein
MPARATAYSVTVFDDSLVHVVGVMHPQGDAQEQGWLEEASAHFHVNSLLPGHP